MPLQGDRPVTSVAGERSFPGRDAVPHIVVVGGGIAGLAAAHRVSEAGTERGSPVDLTLLEAGDRLGGIIATERTDGYLVEEGPDSFLTEKPWGLQLCERVGLTDQLVGTREAYRRTFVVHEGRLRPLPEGFLLLAPTRLTPVLRSPLFSWRGKLRMGIDLLLPRGPAGEDESVGNFVSRRFGREVLDRVVQPLVSGIYGGDPNTVSLRATMPRFLEMERQYRSIIRALRRSPAAGHGKPGDSGPRWGLFVSLMYGMGTLVEAIAQRLPRRVVRLGSRAVALARPGGSEKWRIDLADGTQLLADGVILATPAYHAAQLTAGVDPALSVILSAIPYASSATVTLAYRRAEIGHLLDGFGFVVPRTERQAILACTFSSIKYPSRAPAGDVLLRVFVGGDHAGPWFDRDDRDLRAVVERELGVLLGISAKPRLVRVRRHPAAMPQYLVGHGERVQAIASRAALHPGLAVAGAAYHGVGLPDCIHAGEAAAEIVLAFCREGRAGPVQPLPAGRS